MPTRTKIQSCYNILEAQGNGILIMIGKHACIVPSIVKKPPIYTPEPLLEIYCNSLSFLDREFAWAGKFVGPLT